MVMKKLLMIMEYYFVPMVKEATRRSVELVGAAKTYYIDEKQQIVEYYVPLAKDTSHQLVESMGVVKAYYIDERIMEYYVPVVREETI